MVRNERFLKTLAAAFLLVIFLGFSGIVWDALAEGRKYSRGGGTITRLGDPVSFFTGIFVYSVIAAAALVAFVLFVMSQTRLAKSVVYTSLERSLIGIVGVLTTFRNGAALLLVLFLLISLVGIVLRW